MEYCPFCSGALSKPAKVCPHCKKALGLDIYQSVYSPGETTDKNKKARRRLWFTENARFILPGVFLIAGLLAGAIFMFGYATVHFQLKETNYENQISNLNQIIGQADARTATIKDSLQVTITSQDTIIQILTEQKDLMRRMMTFTRRLANNSTVQPNTTAEGNYYRRNFLYLERLYNAQHELLSGTQYPAEDLPNLKTVPSLLE